MQLVFDVNGTLTDPAGLGEPWGRPDLGGAMLDAAVQSAMVAVATGAAADQPFTEHVRGGVVVVGRREGLADDEALVDAALDRAAALDPWPDAADALDRLRHAGHRIAALTNSGADGGRSTIEAAGLLGRFDDILGADAAGTFKPHPDVYAAAARSLGADASELMLVAAHGWDIAGANRAGWRTMWISRGEGTLLPAFPAPDLTAEDLAGVADQLSMS